MLKPKGDEIPVSNENREEYVGIYLDWVLNTAIYDQFRAFYLGFHSVCASNALIVSYTSVSLSPVPYSIVHFSKILCSLYLSHTCSHTHNNRSIFN